MASAAKVRQPRLRASCDGCFVAKVKCSKTRPICSRCLSCGIHCRYSPSSRAGKPKSDRSNDSHSPDHHDAQQMHSLMDDSSMTYSTPQHSPHDTMFAMEKCWATPPTNAEGSMSRDPALATGLSLLGVDERTMSEHDPMSAASDPYSTAMRWTPPEGMSCQLFPDMPVAAAHMEGSHARSQAFDVAMPMPLQWAEMVSYPPVQTPTSIDSHYFPSPNTTPGTYSATPYHLSLPPATNGSSCRCFNICLLSLQALHDASASGVPPFEQVLSVNAKAVEGCAEMLACINCLSPAGVHTARMLLATVLGKVISVYRSATRSYLDIGNMKMFEDTPAGSRGSGPGFRFGAYQLNEKWLEMEILARELRRLQEVYIKYREACADASDDSEVTKAMIVYLGQNIDSTLDLITRRKVDAAFVT